MAAIYDEQGNYVGDDGAPSLDQMKLELVKKNQPLSSQIPGYDRPVPPAQTKPDPLGAAAGNFTELATKFNPLMMAKSMREAAGIVTVPAVAALKGVGESITTSPSGTYTSGQAPKYAEQVAKQFMEANAPQTPMTQEFAGAIAPYMADLPAYLGHLSTGRPALTPNDLRVMGAEATRVGRQVRDIPTDFANAQSGLQKLDPITGQPTMGSRLGQAERGVTQAGMRVEKALDPIVQDIMAKGGTSAEILSAMAGQPMYAMRPEGSRLQTAVMPATAKQASATHSPAYDIVSSVIDSTTMTPVQALDEIQNKFLRAPEAAPARKAFENFLKQKAAEMYPDAPTPADAVQAYKARFSDREASAAHTLGMYDEFLQTPEGIQFRAALDLPSADELPAMHEAAANWLNSQFTNYILEKVGTPNEPAAKLAGQGLTFNPPEDVFNLADMSGRVIGNKRAYAGMPAQTAMDEALVAANQQLEDLRQQAADATVRKREQIQAAIDAGYGAEGGPNLGQYEPFAQASREANKATEAYKKQQKVVDNLRLGTAYENAVDQAISAPTAQELRNELEYAEQQFYPSLMRTPDSERAYTASVRQLRNLGFEDLARKFYDDVMSRKIHLDKVPKMTVEKYIRQTAEERIDKERKEQAAVAAYKNAVDTQFKRSADAYIPNDKVFGNVGALEITDRFTPDEVAKLVSEDTTALDVCIGEGGTTSGRPNLWHPGTGNRQYEPIYNVATGERNPNATSPRTTYINAVRDGSQMVSFRDTVTGEPVAIFDFNPSSRTGRYNIHFASGRRNGKIKPEYVDGIKAYLNSRADSIHDVGDNLYNTTGISDSERSTSTKLAGMINMPISEFAKYDLSNLPRFITTPELRNYIENLKANEPAVQTPAIASQRPSESIEAYTSGAVASAIDNVLDSQRRQLTEAGEEFYIPAAEAFFADVRGYFNAYLDAQGPARALELTNQRLYDLESDYANNNRIGANIIAEGIVELIHTLGLQSEYVQNRMAAEATRQQPRAVAQRGDPIPDNLDAEDILGRYRDRLTPEQQQYLREFSQRWENTNYPDELSMEFNRWVQNNRLAPEGRPDYMRMAQDATATLTREMGADAGDEMRAVIRNLTDANGLDPAENTEAFVSGLRRAANVADRGTVEIALNELADQMESEFMRDWEPEVAPAQQAAQPFDFTGAVDRITDGIAANLGGVISERFDTVAHRIAEQINPRLDPTGYAEALRAVNPALEHVAVVSGLNELADLIAPPTALRAADLDNMRNDRIIQVEDILNNPESDPNDLRAMAFAMSGMGNMHWAPLAENERRDYAQALRQRANYIEFNPRDFAQRLMGEEGPEHYDDAITLLENNQYDHETLRGLPPTERPRAAQATAVEMERLIRGQGAQPPTEEAAAMQWMQTQPRGELVARIEPGRWDAINRTVDSLQQLLFGQRQVDPDAVVADIREGRMPQFTNGFSFFEREIIARDVNDYLALNNPRGREAGLEPIRDPEDYRIAAEDIANLLEENYYTDLTRPRDAIRLIRQHLRALRRNGEMAFEDLLGMATTAYEWSPELLNALEVVLEDLVERYQGMEGNTNGGPVRGYQKGGSVKADVPTPWLFSVPTYSETVAYEMYPGQKGQDDQRDAARHMLAAGTLSRKYGPGVAEFLGKAHEFTTSPLQAVKTLFGGKMPADYGMDTHNNTVGAQLGQRAKSQAELEDLVQAEAERASRTQTPGQAFIKRANGGIVQQNPTTDQMRYALMMRRK